MVTVDFRCPDCRHMLSADVDQIGTGADCPNCAADVKVPFMFGAVLAPERAQEVYATIPWKLRADAWLKTTLRFVVRFGRVPGASADSSLGERYGMLIQASRTHLVGMHQITANLEIAVLASKAYVYKL